MEPPLSFCLFPPRSLKLTCLGPKLLSSGSTLLTVLCNEPPPLLETLHVRYSTALRHWLATTVGVPVARGFFLECPGITPVASNIARTGFAARPGLCLFSIDSMVAFPVGGVMQVSCFGQYAGLVRHSSLVTDVHLKWSPEHLPNSHWIGQQTLRRKIEELS